MKNVIFIFSIFFTLSCSQINTEEREHYGQSKLPDLRHGIIVVDPANNISHKFEKLDPRSINRGKEIYQRDCLSCHGADGKGKGPKASSLNARPANLVATANEVHSFKFYMAISKWKGDMPGWENPYSAEELEDISDYIKSLR